MADHIEFNVKIKFTQSSPVMAGDSLPLCHFCEKKGKIERATHVSSIEVHVDEFSEHMVAAYLTCTPCRDDLRERF